MTKVLQPISVKSLGLSPEVELTIQKIAGGGPTPDLDTQEEFRLAAETLKQIRSKTDSAIYRITSPVTLNEGVELVGYRIATISVEGGTASALIRRNLATGHEENILKDIRGCLPYDPGTLVEIQTDGKNVYVRFETSRKDGWFGRVVQDKKKARVIQFFEVDDILDRGIFGFTTEGGQVFVQGKTKISDIPVLVNVAGAELTYFRGNCR